MGREDVSKLTKFSEPMSGISGHLVARITQLVYKQWQQQLYRNTSY